MVRSVDNIITAASVEGGVAGQILYQARPDVTSFIGPGVAGQILTSNGTAGPPTYQTSSAIPPTYTIFQSGSGSYTTPVGASYAIVEMVGGGGGGGINTGSSTCGGGGGGGGFLRIRCDPGTYSYSVGAAGTGGGGPP